MPKHPLARRLLVALGTLLASAGMAFAQSDVCRSYRAELAALDRGAGPYARLAERQRAEIGVMQARLRAMQCSGFFQSWECRAGNDRLAAMVSNYHALAARARAGGDGERRAQLQAAVAHYCRGSDDAAERPRRASGRLVCVRTCDGSFFPLENKARGGEGPEAMCQALCPGAETAVYRLPGDSDLARAVSLDGDAYTDLPAAFRFQSARVSTCGCRKPGESWASVLEKAESLLPSRKGDILVTEAKAEELSRPKRPIAAKATPRRDLREPEETGSLRTDTAFDTTSLRTTTHPAARAVRFVSPVEERR